MIWRCFKLYSPGIACVVMGLLIPVTGNSNVVVVVRLLVLGGTLMLSTHEKLARKKRRHNGRS